MRIKTKAIAIGWVCIPLFVCAGCLNDGSYRIVAMRHYTVDRGTEDGRMIAFTIRHGRSTIKAHCQAWDIRNTCSYLQVGGKYAFEREQPLDYLTLENFNSGTATLAVEEEAEDN